MFLCIDTRLSVYICVKHTGAPQYRKSVHRSRIRIALRLRSRQYQSLHHLDGDYCGWNHIQTIKMAVDVVPWTLGLQLLRAVYAQSLNS